jgi:hypothetical protein
MDPSGMPPMKIETVGLDIAKQIFQAHGLDRTGKVVT